MGCSADCLQLVGSATSQPMPTAAGAKPVGGGLRTCSIDVQDRDAGACPANSLAVARPIPRLLAAPEITANLFVSSMIFSMSRIQASCGAAERHCSSNSFRDCPRRTVCWSRVRVG